MVSIGLLMLYDLKVVFNCSDGEIKASTPLHNDFAINRDSFLAKNSGMNGT
jgi:hypothetical protein